MKTKRIDPVDPEPFSVLVGAVGIIGGLASTISAWKTMARGSPSETREKVLGLLGEASDWIRYLEADLAIIGRLLAEAEIPGDRKFRPEAEAFLHPHQFSRYERATDSLFERLRKLLKITNRLDALLPRLSDVEIRQAVSSIGDARGRLHRLLRDSERSVDGAVDDIVTVCQQLDALIRSL
jgi:hypothetical protein